MADLHHEFQHFHDIIQLSAGKQAALQIARNIIRERIRRYFSGTLKQPVPKFRCQGSDAMNTIVNPVNGEYSTTDGVYLQHLPPSSCINWPTPATVQSWLANATGGRPLDDHTGVRARYAGPYHVDLRTYGQLRGKLMLAVNSDDGAWNVSDPMPFIRWFRSYVNLRGEQLRRVVMYLKAWADLQAGRRGAFPGRLILTVLAANHFQNHKRDDLAFAKTLMAISTTVRLKFQVLNPIYIYEELSSALTQTQKKLFQTAVLEAAADAFEAVNVKDRYDACRFWRKQLGDRFPIAE